MSKELKCKWCGVPHERGMNTLCPFTRAEATLAAIATLPDEWRYTLLSNQEINSDHYFKGEHVAKGNCANQLEALIKARRK